MNDKIIDRIKALLAKAASTDHEAEAETFFAKAYELMERYQLDSNDLEKDDPIGNERVAQRKGAAAPDWDFRLMFAVANYFGCRAIQCSTFGDVYNRRRGCYIFTENGHYMDLVGRESARITAIEMHKYLVATVRKLGRERSEEMGLKPDICARRIGVALRIRINVLTPRPEKAKTETAKSNALVTVDKVLALYNKLHPDARAIKGPGAWTTNEAQKIAEGISLNLQTGQSKVARLK
jgi:hypothetical protein